MNALHQHNVVNASPNSQCNRMEAVLVLQVQIQLTIKLLNSASAIKVTLCVMVLAKIVRIQYLVAKTVQVLTD